jgi:hypothetical protein
LSDLGILNLKEEAPPRGYKRTRYDTDKYRGAFETFLAKVRLRASDKEKINKILDYYSKKYAGKGISKEALVAYLAAKSYSVKELQTILGEVNMPNVDIYSNVLEITKKTVNKRTGLSSAKKKAIIAAIMISAGNDFVMACHGDGDALGNMLKTQDTLHLTNTILVINNMLISQDKAKYFYEKLIPIYNEIAEKTTSKLVSGLK